MSNSSLSSSRNDTGIFSIIDENENSIINPQPQLEAPQTTTTKQKNSISSSDRGRNSSSTSNSQATMHTHTHSHTTLSHHSSIECNDDSNSDLNDDDEPEPPPIPENRDATLTSQHSIFNAQRQESYIVTLEDVPPDETIPFSRTASRWIITSKKGKKT